MKLFNVNSMINHRAKLVSEGRWCKVDQLTHIRMLRLSFIKIQICGN